MLSATAHSRGQWIAPDDALLLNKPIEVVSPSNADRKDKRNELEHIIQENRNMTENPRLKEDAQMEIPHRCSQLKRYRKLLDQAQSEAAVIMSFNHNFATVYASSRLRSVRNIRFNDNQITQWSQNTPFKTTKLEDTAEGSTPKLGWDMDWCLLTVSSGRALSTSLPPTNNGVNLPLGLNVSRWSAIDPYKNYDVAKRGRTTGWTKGVITAVASLLNNVVCMETETGHGKPTLCHAILNSAGKDFAWGGDSGSLVLLDEKVPQHKSSATIVGLLCGFNQFSRVAYMIPMDLLIEDIERVTGGKVVSPVMV
jgi:hypothetical protein